MIKVILLVVVASFGCRERVPSARAPLALQSLEDRSTVVLWRESQVHWLGLFDPELRLTWASKLEGVPTVHLGGTYPLVLTGDRVSLLTHDDLDGESTVRVETFARRDGAHVATRLGVTREEVAGSTAPRFTMDGLVYDYFAGELVVIDPANGVEVRRTTLPFVPDNVIVQSRVALLQGGLADATVASDGTIRPLLGTRGCILDDKIWKLAEDGNRHSFVTVDDASGQLPLDLVGAHATVEHCARYGTKLVAILSITPFMEDPRREIWILAQDGSTAAKIRIGAARLRAYPVGTLPRFVPMVEGDKGMQSVAMVDLELGRIAWRVKLGRSIVADPFLVDQRWYFVEQSSSPEISIVDAATGLLLTAKRLRGPFGLRPPTQASVTNGRWSVLRSRERPASDAMLSVIDPVSLVHLAGPRIEVTDVHLSSPLASISRN
jgi:hypothetical protein